MPGPRNATKRKKARTSKETLKPPLLPVEKDDGHDPHLATRLPLEHDVAHVPPPYLSKDYSLEGDSPAPLFAIGGVGAKDALPQEPAIYDPGNGPRVKNVHAFLVSSFAAPPSLEDDLCAEFAQEEVLDMLCTVLPYELAMVSVCGLGA
jgi:hypothetical protein